MRGRFISFEGGEGAGKSTVLAAVHECLEMHGVDVVVTREPGGTALGEAVRGWYDRFFAPRSAVALRHAARAARSVLREHAVATLRTLERQYLDELMQTTDATEGCAAFIEKRPPVWRNR